MEWYDLAIMQRKLDRHISEKHNLKGKDLYPKKQIALLVELGELANEVKFFKFWKSDTRPNDSTCKNCSGLGEIVLEKENRVPCNQCVGTGKLEKNPVLEEYVDGLHFILSVLGTHHVYQDKQELQLMFKKSKTLHYSNLHDQFSVLFYEISNGLYSRIDLIFNYYLGLGKLLNFSKEDIIQGYLKKNEKNFERQANDY